MNQTLLAFFARLLAALLLLLDGAAIAHDRLAFTIEYRDGKFNPDRLEIPPGATVTFANLGGKPVWPASNIHPTHQILPEFDPKQPIEAGASWAFKFDKPGTWRFHNHLLSSEGGVISVLGPPDANPEPIQVLDLSSVHLAPLPALSAEQKLAWLEAPDESIVFEAVRQYGPAEVIKVIADVGVALHKDCHQRAHVVGRSAYKIFGPLAFGLSSHECMSGSYHGAMEAMLWQRGARNIGADVSQMCSATRNAFFRHQCVHGAGHGLMAWTDYHLPEALGLCDQLKASRDQSSCYSGVFMENVAGGLAEGGGMGTGHYTQYLSDDPHFPCTAIDAKYLPSCYAFQSSRMGQIFKWDFKKISAACEQAPLAVRGLCFFSMGRDVDSRVPRKPQKALEYCSYTQDQGYHEQCLVGAVQNKFWEASGAEDALGFCKFLTAKPDKEACYAKIISQARQVLMTPQELDAFCGQVEPGYHYRIPLPALARKVGGKLFGLAADEQTRSLDSCYRILPQWDRFWAKF